MAVERDYWVLIKKRVGKKKCRPDATSAGAITTAAATWQKCARTEEVQQASRHFSLSLFFFLHVDRNWETHTHIAQNGRKNSGSGAGGGSKLGRCDENGSFSLSPLRYHLLHVMCGFPFWHGCIYSDILKATLMTKRKAERCEPQAQSENAYRDRLTCSGVSYHVRKKKKRKE